MQRLSQRLPTFASSELRRLAMERCVRAGAALRRMRPADMTRAILVAETALTVTLAVVAGRMVWTVFEPPAWAASGGVLPAPAKVHRGGTPAILTEIDPFHRASLAGGVPTAARAPETMLDLRLYGIRAGTADGRGGAIVATPDNVQGVFYVGQEIMPGVRLEQVLPDRIVIRRNGVSETLSFDRDTVPQAAAAAPPPEAAATAEEPLRRLDVDIRSLATLLRFTKAERGLLLEGSADPSVLQQTGLEPGDILLAVNGTPAGDTGALAALAASGTLRLTLEVERKGQRKIHRLAIDRVQ